MIQHRFMYIYTIKATVKRYYKIHIVHEKINTIPEQIFAYFDAD